VISPVRNNLPDSAIQFRYHVYGLLPRIKLTDFLVEVDAWTSFSQYFTDE
jgi:hypothetical protein